MNPVRRAFLCALAAATLVSAAGYLLGRRAAPAQPPLAPAVAHSLPVA
ncbi:MAG: hypothetical protein ACK47B_14120 [Armatimonadota bacterium]